MDNRVEQSRKGACETYNWDATSAAKKATSDISIRVGIPKTIFSVSKNITAPHNPQTDAYRNCGSCGKHFNYHGKNDNNYKNHQINPFPKKK